MAFEISYLIKSNLTDRTEGSCLCIENKRIAFKIIGTSN